ncbi:hypothetical protein J7J90_04950 [Candidatus Micrarchaeota archaeon]|nr:hypothetical protein [Candidatus Micrarchaeota archaeon]
MKKYEVEGEVKLGIDKRSFKIEVNANSENHAKEKTYAWFGAKNKTKKGNVHVKNIKVVE